MAPLWAPVFPPPARAATGGAGGRRRTGGETILGLILTKLGTGEGWKNVGQAGTTAFRHFQELTKAGVWEETWRAVVAHATETDLTKREQVAATDRLPRRAEGPRGSLRDWLDAGGRAAADALDETTREIEGRRKEGPKPRVWPRRPTPQRRTIWTIPDELWTVAAPVLEGHCPRISKRGRPRLPFRQVLEGIIWHCRSGAQWELVPARYGHFTNVHRWMMRWIKSW